MSISLGKSNRKMYMAQLLYDSVEDHNVEAVNFLLQKGANPNLILPKKGISSFHLAVGCDKKYALKLTGLILESGGDPNVKSEDGLTPLHIAAAWGRLDVLQALLNYGGDPMIIDDNFMTPIDYAIKEKHPLCLRLLKQLPISEESFTTNEDFNTAFISDELKDTSNIKPEGKNIQNSFNGAHTISNENQLNKTSINLVEHPNDSKHANGNIKNDHFKPDLELSYEQMNYLNDITKKGPSGESGIFIYNSADSSDCDIETNSFYLTCSENRLQELSQDESKEEDFSYLTVLSEVYKYEDKAKNIVLYEERLIKSSDSNESTESGNSSKLSSVPDSFVYDTDTLRQELTLHGCTPGPITYTTKKIYLKKLYNLKKHPGVQSQESCKKYSVEIEKTKNKANWYEENLDLYKSLEDALFRDFSNKSQNWREGTNKSSFNYLLLDPRITQNLPHRVDTMNKKEIWETFLNAVFYIGKGKNARPYSHLYEAISLWKERKSTCDNEKLNRILEIWTSNNGIVCLHLFHNIIPAEAYTREAAMISALCLENITNNISGQFYGEAACWSQKYKKIFGTYLLYKAMIIFLNEGERQIYPCDIDQKLL